MRSFVDILVRIGAGEINGGGAVRFPGMERTTEFEIRHGSLEVSSQDGLAQASLFQKRTDQCWTAWLLGELTAYKTSDRDPLRTFVEDLSAERAAPALLRGRFVLVAYDSRYREWNFWTDRFGTLHIYYTGTKGGSVVGTFSPAVAASAHRRSLDWAGITAFFQTGFFPSDRTFYEDVRILRPASHYVFDEGGKLLRSDRYWKWEYLPDMRRSHDETVVGFAEVFREVMADATRNGRIALPISGGLDSRSTVAAARFNGHTIWSYSYGYSDDSVETRIARRIAEGRRLPFSSFTIKPYLFEKLATVLSCVEGFQDVTQCRQAFVAEELDAHADYVIAAHWGDVWLDDMGFADANGQHRTDDQLLDHAVQKMKKRGGDWLVDNICREHLNDTASVLHNFASEELGRLDHIADPNFRLKAFKTDTWSFRWTIASLRMFQTGAFPRLPFYDTRITDFLATVPSALLRGRRLQIDYLKRFAPDLAGITWQPYDANLFHYQHFNTLLLPKRAAKKAWRILTGRKPVARNWEVQFLDEGGNQVLEQWLLRPGLRLHEFVPPQKLTDLLENFYRRPAADSGYTVSMLLTFSSWLEHYA